MNSRRTTNTLLFLILIALIANIIMKLFPTQSAEAETFKLDNCITAKKFDKPAAYLHVVTHEAVNE